MLRALATALCWPGVVAHEACHWLAGQWAAREDSLHLTGTRPRYDVVEWVEGAALRIVLVAYAPVLVGLLVGLTWALVRGVPDPESLTDWAILAIACGWYGVFVLPSDGDIKTAQEGFDRARG